MRLRTSMSVTLCVFAVGLGVAGCSPGGSGSSSSGSATTSPGGSGSSSSGSATTSPANPDSTAQAEAGASTPASSQQPQTAGSGSGCQPANLSLTLGANIGETGTGQRTQVVDLTNEGSSACTMEGFPGVDLVGAADGQENYTWPLVRSSASYASESHQGISEVTLQPGGTAHFDLRYLPGAPGDGNKLISVDKTVITPPNDYTQAELTWHQDVVLQDEATNPGTYIMPVVSGS
jgi:hypothetical protein